MSAPAPELNNLNTNRSTKKAINLLNSFESVLLADMKKIAEKLQNETSSKITLNKERKAIKLKFLEAVLKFYEDVDEATEQKQVEQQRSLQENVKTMLSGFSSDERASIIEGKISRIRVVMQELFGNPSQVKNVFGINSKDTLVHD